MENLGHHCYPATIRHLGRIWGSKNDLSVDFSYVPAGGDLDHEITLSAYMVKGSFRHFAMIEEWLRHGRNNLRCSISAIVAFDAGGAFVALFPLVSDLDFGAASAAITQQLRP